MLLPIYLFSDPLVNEECSDLGPYMPKLVEPSSVMTAIVGTHRSWTCSALADKTPLYKWYKDGKVWGTQLLSCTVPFNL